MLNVAFLVHTIVNARLGVSIHRPTIRVGLDFNRLRKLVTDLQPAVADDQVVVHCQTKLGLVTVRRPHIVEDVGRQQRLGRMLRQAGRHHKLRVTQSNRRRNDVLRLERTVDDHAVSRTSRIIMAALVQADHAAPLGFTFAVSAMLAATNQFALVAFQRVGRLWASHDQASVSGADTDG